MELGQLLFLAFLIAVAAGIYWGTSRLFGPRPGSAYTAEERAEHQRKIEAWQQEYNAANPKGPALTEAEIQQIEAKHAALARPAIQLTPDPDAEVTPNGSRLGGPAFLEAGQGLPIGKDGEPLMFLAQLDFGALLPLEGFPTQGLLQFFIGTDDLHGADFDAPTESNIALLWHPNGLTDPEAHAPSSAGTIDHPWPLMGNASTSGVVLNGEPMTSPIGYNDFRAYGLLDGLGRRANIREVEDRLYDGDEMLAHHVGGNPCFVQSDPRSTDHMAVYDTVLLRLTSDDNVQWGDVGEANFLIRSDDLAARRFDRVLFTWDCS